MPNTQNKTSPTPDKTSAHAEALRKQRDHFAGFVKPDAEVDPDAPPDAMFQRPVKPARGGVRPWMIVAGLLVICGSTLLIKGSGLKTYAMCKISPGYWERMSGPE